MDMMAKWWQSDGIDEHDGKVDNMTTSLFVKKWIDDWQSNM